MTTREFYRHGEAVRSKLPVVGKVRLGYKDEAKRGAPVATPYFVLKDASQLIPNFGEQPTEIGPIFIPVDDETAVANRMLRYYTETYGLTCWGNGLQATRKVDKAHLVATGEAKTASKDTTEAILQAVRCPCELLNSGDCKESMYFRFSIPEVEGIGVFQLATRSRNSIDNIFSCLDMIRAASISPEYPQGRISGIPLKMSLRRTQVYSIGDSKTRGGKRWVYLVFLEPYEQMSLKDFYTQLASRPPMMMLPEAEVYDGEGSDEDVEEAQFVEYPVNPPQPGPSAQAKLPVAALTEADFEAPKDLPKSMNSLVMFWQVAKPYDWDIHRVNELLGEAGPLHEWLKTHKVNDLYQMWLREIQAQTSSGEGA